MPNRAQVWHLWLPLLGAVVVALALPVVRAAPAWANHGTAVSTFPDPSISSPGQVTAGPDGALWFVNRYGGESGCSSSSGPCGSIGRIGSDGTVTDYSDPSIDFPVGITAGPDGALWFTNSGGVNGTGSIGRITTSGVVSNFADPSIMQPDGIAVGSDGALWFVNAGHQNSSGQWVDSSIGRITTAGTVTSYTSPSIYEPEQITAGADGNLWFTNCYQVGGSIGRITTAGVVSNFESTNFGIESPQGITDGPDGALWFTNGSLDGSIGRITTAGVLTDYTDPSIFYPAGITAGPDGNLWFTNSYGGNSIGRITTAGEVSNFTDPGIEAPVGITTGPDGALWFTNLGQWTPLPGQYVNPSIGRITTPVPTAPTISGTPASSANDGFPYSFGFSVDGWPVPTVSVTSGHLPPGLNLSAAGVLSGTPSTSGTYGPITVTATNGSGPDATDTFSITVVTTPPTFSGTPSSILNVGTPYGFAFTVGGAPPPTLTRTGKLPPGLRLSATGVLSGTPYQGGTFGPVTVTAANGIAPNATDTFTITVVSPALSLFPGSGTRGQHVTVYGGGSFRRFENVTVSYTTGLTAPNPASVVICRASATNRGTFSCKGKIPAGATAGATGAHRIVAKGQTSHFTVKGVFSLN